MYTKGLTFHLSTYYYMYSTCKISKKQKMHACKAAAGGPLLEILYIDPLLSVMILYYNKLYQISSLEANLILEDLKQLCRQKPPSQV